MLNFSFQLLLNFPLDAESSLDITIAFANQPSNVDISLCRISNLKICSSAGEWKRDAKHGFGIYYYVNNDIYEGSWKKDLRHGMGTYLYADTGTKYMGTWIEDCMQGPGQLVHARHRFYGSWKHNLVRIDRAKAVLRVSKGR